MRRNDRCVGSLCALFAAVCNGGMCSFGAGDGKEGNFWNSGRLALGLWQNAGSGERSVK